jgi:histidinol-phosphate aminotransferase
MTGANHVLPTGGLARAYSGLSVLDFLRWTTWQEILPEAAAGLAHDVAALADTEQLPGHAAAARGWASAPNEAEGTPARRGAAPLPLRRRAGYGTIPVYAPAPGGADLDLSDNTNLFGPAPSALDALRASAAESLSRYPEPWSDALRQSLARYAGVRPEEIVVGCGSDDLLDSAFRAFGEPGDTVAHCVPTFSMVPVFARANGLVPAAAPFTPDLELDTDALLAARASITYLASPNNPTGTIASPEAIARVFEGASGVVILDEAYAEFSGVTRGREAPQHGRLMIVRTLSKAFGLAGLRVGWAIGAAALIAEVEKARGPYKVSAPAERAARAAVEHDLDWMRERVAAVIASRDRLADALRGRGFAPLPSAANFLLVPVAEADAAAAALEPAGIAVRTFRGLAGIGDALRITAGPWPAMERLLVAFDRVPR